MEMLSFDGFLVLLMRRCFELVLVDFSSLAEAKGDYLKPQAAAKVLRIRVLKQVQQ